MCLLPAPEINGKISFDGGFKKRKDARLSVYCLGRWPTRSPLHCLGSWGSWAPAGTRGKPVGDSHGALTRPAAPAEVKWGTPATHGTHGALTQRALFAKQTRAPGFEWASSLPASAISFLGPSGRGVPEPS